MTRWLTIEELARVAFGTQHVVMVNEAHDGMRRCVRTRRVGVRLVAAAHALGVRDLAMEALPPPEPGAPEAWTELPSSEGGYLGQPDMRELMGAALVRGWRLWSYEEQTPPELMAHPEQLLTMEFTNRREREQALNLAELASRVPRLFVWCGNGHATRHPVGDWVPMGHQFVQITGRELYVVDQTVTVNWNDEDTYLPDGALEGLERELAPYGGTASVLHDDAPEPLLRRDADAFVLSVDNRLEE
jgi:hypothetical protein